MCSKINKYLSKKFSFELIFVNDFSKDKTQLEINKCIEKFSFKIISLNNTKNLGISACIDKAVKYTTKEIIITIDGDLQNDPLDIVKLIEYYQNINDDNLGLIIGQRVNRKDSVIKKITSKFGYITRKLFFNDQIRDVACGLRLIIKKAYLELPYFDNMHRYYSVIFKRHGFNVVGVNVNHFERKHGKSKFGVFNRLLPGIFDVFGVMWLLNRKKK